MMYLLKSLALLILNHQVCLQFSHNLTVKFLSTCKKLFQFINNNNLWKYLCMKHFPNNFRIGDWHDWKSLYKNAYVRERSNYSFFPFDF